MENKFCITGEPHHIKAFWEDLIHQGYHKPGYDKLNATYRQDPRFIVNRDEEPLRISAFETCPPTCGEEMWVFKLPQDWMKALKLTLHIINTTNEKP